MKWTLGLFHFAAFLLLRIRSQKRSLHRNYLYKMDKIWDHLSACNEQEFLLTTRLLLALLHNIIQDPQNDKHRRLRASSKVGKTMQQLIIDTYKKPCKPAAIWLCKYIFHYNYYLTIYIYDVIRDVERKKERQMYFILILLIYIYMYFILILLICSFYFDLEL